MEKLTCKYCGRGGFKCNRGLATHRRYNEDCYNQWKAEQEEYDKSRSKVTCQICKKSLRNISNTHLKTHGITQQEYKQKYPNAPLFAEGLLEIQRDNRESTIQERYTPEEIKYILGEKAHKAFVKKYGPAKEYHQKLREENPEKYAEAAHKSSNGIRKRYKELKKDSKKYVEFNERKFSKIKLTCLRRYGTEFAHQNPEIGCKLGTSLEKMIKRHGEERGKELHKNWIKRQSESKTLKGKIAKYGEEEGTRRYNYWLEQFNKGLCKGHSNVSQELFWAIIKLLPECSDARFAENGGEEILLGKQPDFIWNNSIIEFYGDYFHASPTKFNPDDHINNLNCTAKEKWDKDEERINLFLDNGYNVLVVWEYEYKEDPESIVKMCCCFLST